MIMVRRKKRIQTEVINGNGLKNLQEVLTKKYLNFLNILKIKNTVILMVR